MLWQFLSWLALSTLAIPTEIPPPPPNNSQLDDTLTLGNNNNNDTPYPGNGNGDVDNSSGLPSDNNDVVINPWDQATDEERELGLYMSIFEEAGGDVMLGFAPPRERVDFSHIEIIRTTQGIAATIATISKGDIFYQYGWHIYLYIDTGAAGQGNEYAAIAVNDTTRGATYFRKPTPSANFNWYKGPLGYARVDMDKYTNTSSSNVITVWGNNGNTPLFVSSGGWEFDREANGETWEYEAMVDVMADRQIYFNLSDSNFSFFGVTGYRDRAEMQPDNYHFVRH